MLDFIVCVSLEFFSKYCKKVVTKMDITPLFKACIKTVKTRNKAFGIQSPTSEDKQRILRSKPKTAFMTTAKDITSQITRLRDFLLEHRERYLSFFNNVPGEEEMTDIERDQIDYGAQRIINTCLHLLKEFRNDNRKITAAPQLREYMEAVADLIDMYLKAVCKIHSELKALRIKRAHDMRTLSRLESLNTKPSMPKSLIIENVRAIKKDEEEMKKNALNETETEETDNVKKMDLSENEVAVLADEEITAEELQIFETENSAMLNDLSGMQEEVKVIESKVLHIAELQEIFTEKVIVYFE